VIGDINNNNGILSCKNNKIEKEISELKRKIEEHKYLLYRLQNNTEKIKHEQEEYDKLKQENSKMVEKEDKVNLTQI
jgi:predicted RNase H-like nuclease (RuvC/YqgF family)